MPATVHSRGGRPHILVAEDDALVAAMVRDALEYAGFAATVVSAAEDALSLAVLDVPFDLLLTDVHLAGPMNGWELAEAIREMRPDVPIVYVSADAAAAAADLRVPNSLFFSKPYNPVAVCAAIRERLTPSACPPDIAPAPRCVVQFADRRARRA
ncbi:MAG: response regulator [Variibacter sp.]|nr:response regulator [Variibacter sp.]